MSKATVLLEVRATLVELGWSSSGGSASRGRCSVRDAMRGKSPLGILSFSACICSLSASVSGVFREWRSARSSRYVFSVKATLVLSSGGVRAAVSSVAMVILGVERFRSGG